MRAIFVMRFKNIIFRVLPCLFLAGVPAHSALAESFLSKLFGWGSGSSGKPAAVTAEPKPVPSLGSFSRTSPAGSGSSYWNSSAGYDGEDYGGAYRTLCVRTCDGYYFPISSSASSRRFSRDTRQCQAMCGSEARLFYLPRGSDDIKNMTDTSGRVYGKLPSAFAYRKSLISGCACKPMPWSTAEAARHQQYAMIEAIDKAQERNAELARLAADEASVEQTAAPTTSASVALKIAEAIVPIVPLQAEPAPGPAPDFAVAAPESGNGDVSQPSQTPVTEMGHLLPASMQTAVAEDPILESAVLEKRPRKTRQAKSSAARPTQTASWFNAQPKYAWPGDAPARRR